MLILEEATDFPHLQINFRWSKRLTSKDQKASGSGTTAQKILRAFA
jgi:hypothetical protein